MSSVRMCDRCGLIFSENEDGWQTFQGATIKRTEGGGSKSVTVMMDACPACAVSTEQTPVPKLAGPAGHDAFVLDGADDGDEKLAP